MLNEVVIDRGMTAQLCNLQVGGAPRCALLLRCAAALLCAVGRACRVC